MPRESKDNKRRRAERILAILRETYPDARCALNHANPLQLLVATILSAQCTDERVNIVTADLFKTHKTARDYAEASQEAMEEAIRSTGFYRNKAKSIRGAARKLVDEFDGKVPRTMDDLLTLPGVARKTANVVLGTAYGLNEGVVVDTHVARLAQRMALTTHTDPPKIERDLMELIPREAWTNFGHLMIFHGRRCCTARKPACDRCPVSDLCPSAFKVNGNSKKAE